MVVGFKVSELDLESTSNRSEYKDLLRDILNGYPTDVETLDSTLKVYLGDTGRYLTYQYLMDFDPEIIPPKMADKLLGNFKKLIIQSMEKFLNSLGIVYKLY